MKRLIVPTAAAFVGSFLAAYLTTSGTGPVDRSDFVTLWALYAAVGGALAWFWASEVAR